MWEDLAYGAVYSAQTYKQSQGKDLYRRTMYTFWKRTIPPPQLSTFDAPDRSETCARRHVSTNAPQALTLLNSKITLDLACGFAGRVLRAGEAEAVKIIDNAYRLSLGRSPDSAERSTMLAFLAKQTALFRARFAEKKPMTLPSPSRPGVDPASAAAVVDLCHVLMNLNEFLYVD